MRGPTWGGLLIVLLQRLIYVLYCDLVCLNIMSWHSLVHQASVLRFCTFLLKQPEWFKGDDAICAPPHPFQFNVTSE